MIPISNFCWQGFRPVEVSNISIGELVSLVNGRGPFVIIHDRQYHLSAFVVPELMIQLVRALDLSLDGSAMATGLLDLLRQSQIVVGENEPASRVAKLAVEHDIEVVIAANRDLFPVGLFIPSVVTERLPHTTLFHQGSYQLRETVVQLTSVGDLPGVIRAIESEFISYHSELLTLQDIKLLICEDHGNEHSVFEAPCKDHPGAVVRVSTI